MFQILLFSLLHYLLNLNKSNNFNLRIISLFRAVYSILHLELCTRILHSERCVMDHSFSAAKLSTRSFLQSTVLAPSLEACTSFIWRGVLNPSFGEGFSILHLERGSQSFIWSGVLNPSFGAGFSILH